MLYILEYNCTDLPVSMNGVAFGDDSYGCPGARWMNGEFSEKYCKGKDSDGNEGVYPWWSTCCDWENNECIAKGNIENYFRFLICFNHGKYMCG